MALTRDDIVFVAMNDPFISTNYMTYVFTYDNVHDQWKHNEFKIKTQKLYSLEKNVSLFSVAEILRKYHGARSAQSMWLNPQVSSPTKRKHLLT